MPLRQPSDDAVPLTGAGLPDYWSTMGGIGVRLGMLGHQIEWGTFNGAVRITASSIGVFNFKMIGPDDERTCEWCGEHIGRVYRTGHFMPDLPKHVNCRHFWDLEYVGKKR
ncbi:hypothetical protein MUO93_08745 [Candidatus Bathyarchaeota archaeon]|nr:hypothetical protein [Candidatus Bathyarchaeota archaeon]